MKNENIEITSEISIISSISSLNSEDYDYK